MSDALIHVLRSELDEVRAAKNPIVRFQFDQHPVEQLPAGQSDGAGQLEAQKGA